MTAEQHGSRRPRRLGRLVAATALVGLAVLPTGSATAASRPRVVIGVIAPVDGGLVEFGRGIRDSVGLAVKEAQDKGTIKGWQLELRVLDDSSDAAKGEQAAKTMARDARVAAVVGPYNSGVGAVVAPVLAKKGIAMLSASNTLTSLTVGEDPARPVRQWDTYFRLVGPDSRQAQFLAAQAKQLGVRTAAVVSETKAVSKGLADAFATAFKAGGGTVSVQQTVKDGAVAADFGPFVAAAAPTRPELVFFGGEYNVAAALRTAATAGGITVPMMGGDGMNDPAYITGSGAAATGTYASGVGVPLARLATSAAWLASYRAAGFTTAPTDYGPYAYDAANLVIAQLAKSLRGKTSIPSNLRAQVVRSLERVSTTGLTGHLEFDEYGDATQPSFTLYRVQGTPPAWTPAA